MTALAESPIIWFQQPDQTAVIPPVSAEMVDDRRREWAEQILATHEESLVKPECVWCPPIAGYPCRPVLQAEQILNGLRRPEQPLDELFGPLMERCPFVAPLARGGSR